MDERDALIGTLLDDACLTLEELSRAGAVPSEWIVAHVHEGLLRTSAEAPSAWRFSSRDLWRVRQIRRFERDFDAVPELAALVADLLQELDRLRARMRRAGLE